MWHLHVTAGLGRSNKRDNFSRKTLHCSILRFEAITSGIQRRTNEKTHSASRLR